MFKKISRTFLFITIVVVVGIVGGAIFTRAQLLTAPEQPIAYSHRTHVEAGVQCLFCHSSALRSSMAGIPSVQKCMGCHDVIAADSPPIEELAAYWEREEPIPWVRVNTEPDFVFFSHQSHLGAGFSCETCHGDVGQMDVVRPAIKMDMGWCLNCHLKQPGQRAVHLADCLTCHK